jgi:hypothetical protein
MSGEIVQLKNHLVSSSIIDKLPKPNPSLGIAYFFFDGRTGETDQRLHNKLIRSLISQLSDTRHGGMSEKVAEFYNDCGVHQPSDDQLQNVLCDILDRFRRAYIVIDALDECTDRKKTLNWVNKLVEDMNRKAKNLHIVVTSRPLPDIQKVFEKLDPHSVHVGAQPTANPDIMNYIKRKMELEYFQKRHDEETRKTIESRLREHADGSYVYLHPVVHCGMVAYIVPSFRWVALQLADLERCSSIYEITQKLKNLPKGLNDTYKRTLLETDEEYRADMMTFLQWLAFSKRPMTIAEIAETITVDFASEDDPVFIRTKRYADPRDVLVRCSSLVSESDWEGKYCWPVPALRPSSSLTVKIGTIKLSHFSVKEYLLSESRHIGKYFHIREDTSHLKISIISVAYLLQFDSFEPQTKDMLHSSPLVEYAAEHWIAHTKSACDDPTLLKLTLCLFTSKTAPLTNWIRIHNIDRSWFHQELSMDKTRVQSALYYASRAGMQQVLYCLLVERGEDPNAKGGYCTKSINSPVTRHRASKIGEKSQLSHGHRARWRERRIDWEQSARTWCVDQTLHPCTPSPCTSHIPCTALVLQRTDPVTVVATAVSRGDTGGHHFEGIANWLGTTD